jgi:hypothetical protein
VQEVEDRELDRAYLDTLPPEERERQRQDRKGRAYRAGYAAFLQGGAVRADPNVFWASEELRAPVIKAVKDLFGPEAQRVPRIMPERNSLTAWSREGERIRFHHDLRLLFVDPVRHAAGFEVQGQLVVEIDESHRANPGGWWRVVRLDLVRARSGSARGARGA